MAEPDYDPRNVEQYRGTTFVTDRKSRYGITADGKFTGRPSIEGAEVQLIAGMDKETSEAARSLLGVNLPAPVSDETQIFALEGPATDRKADLDALIMKFGKRPRKGLYLVVSVTYDSVEVTRRNGLVSSRIDHIE